MTVAPHLKSSQTLLEKTFPNGLPDDYYFPLLGLFYDDFSDRNLSELLSSFTGKDYEVVLNDIANSQTTEKPNEEKIEDLKSLLVPHGYEKWKQEQ